MIGRLAVAIIQGLPGWLPWILLTDVPYAARLERAQERERNALRKWSWQSYGSRVPPSFTYYISVIPRCFVKYSWAHGSWVGWKRVVDSGKARRARAEDIKERGGRGSGLDREGRKEGRKRRELLGLYFHSVPPESQMIHWTQLKDTL